VAKIVKGVAQAEQPGLIIVGKQAIDDDSNQTGQMLSALLGWPQGIAWESRWRDPCAEWRWRD
jgi:electron transfer flavoprotein beta subunit